MMTFFRRIELRKGERWKERKRGGGEDGRRGREGGGREGGKEGKREMESKRRESIIMLWKILSERKPYCMLCH